MANLNTIHPSAIINKKAKIGKNVKIGPFCVIGSDVEIGDGTEIASHVSIQCHTKIGKNVKIFPFVSIDISQDLKYKGEDSWVEVGDNTVLREYVTINNGSDYDLNKTVVGKNCLLMIGTHVAHDCVVGDNVIIANNTVLGGHVTIESNVIIGGMSAIHPKVKIGKGAIIGGMTGVSKDVIPYGNAKCERAYLDGLNIIGLKRAGIDRDQIKQMNQFFEQIFDESQGVFAERVDKLKAEYADNSSIIYILDFINKTGQRGLCMPLSNKGAK